MVPTRRCTAGQSSDPLQDHCVFHRPRASENLRMARVNRCVPGAIPSNSMRFARSVIAMLPGHRRNHFSPEICVVICKPLSSRKTLPQARCWSGQSIPPRPSRQQNVSNSSDEPRERRSCGASSRDGAPSRSSPAGKAPAAALTAASTSETLAARPWCHRALPRIDPLKCPPALSCCGGAVDKKVIPRSWAPPFSAPCADLFSGH